MTDFDTLGVGQAGDIMIETNSLQILHGSQIAAGNFGAANSGNITVRAINSVEIIGFSEELGLGSGFFCQSSTRKHW